MANYGFRLFIEEQLFVYVRGNMVFQVSVTVETNILSTIPGMITVLLLAIVQTHYLYILLLLLCAVIGATNCHNYKASSKFCTLKQNRKAKQRLTGYTSIKRRLIDNKVLRRGTMPATLRTNDLNRYALKEMLLFGLTKEIILTTNKAKYRFKLGQSSTNQRRMAGRLSTKAGQER